MTDLITGVSGTDQFSDPAGNRYAWHRVASAATTNATSVKAAPGHVYGFSLGNAMTTTPVMKFFKLYDKASAPTVGTDVPIMTVPLPADGQVNISFPTGILFSLGIAFAITGAVADTDSTAVAANDIHGGLLYA